MFIEKLENFFSGKNFVGFPQGRGIVIFPETYSFESYKESELVHYQLFTRADELLPVVELVEDEEGVPAAPVQLGGNLCCHTMPFIAGGVNIAAATEWWRRRGEEPQSGVVDVIVIDDDPKNLLAAHKQLREERGLSVRTFRDPKDFLRQYNQREELSAPIVLTDLFFPCPSGSQDNPWRGGEEPLGMINAMAAFRRGATRIAVVSHINHHASYFSTTLDGLFVGLGKRLDKEPIEIHAVDSRRVGVKDWGTVYDLK